MFEAVVGDAERAEPRLEEVGVAVAVVLEGLDGGVELAAVELDDEVLLRRVVSSAAATSRWTCASLRARVSCLTGRLSARSTSVRRGFVTRMP